MKTATCLLSCLPLLLTQCVGPDGMPVAPFGPVQPQPYSVQREQYRTEANDYTREQNLRAQNRGLQDGAHDFSVGEAKSYLRHAQNYDDSTRAAYMDGYDKGYGTGPLPGSGTPGPAPFSDQPDPTYSKGYDYGLRDRVSGRQPDSDAYSGTYDPRYRRSFERGYYDAFESRR